MIMIACLSCLSTTPTHRNAPFSKCLLRHQGRSRNLYSDIRAVVGRTEQEAFDEEFLPLGLMTWNVLNDTCVDLNDNQANIVMSSTSSDNATFLSDPSPIIGYPLSLTHSLTLCCLVDLVDVALACENANNVVTVAYVDCDNPFQSHNHQAKMSLLFSSCAADQFSCSDGTCVDLGRRCDLFPDCPDKVSVSPLFDFQPDRCPV